MFYMFVPPDGGDGIRLQHLFCNMNNSRLLEVYDVTCGSLMLRLGRILYKHHNTVISRKRNFDSNESVKLDFSNVTRPFKRLAFGDKTVQCQETSLKWLTITDNSLKMSELNCPVCATTVNSSHSYYGGKGVCSSCRTFFRRSGEAKLWSLVLQQPIDTDCTAVVMYTRIEILSEYKAHSKWLVCHQDL